MPTAADVVNIFHKDKNLKVVQPQAYHRPHPRPKPKIFGTKVKKIT